MSGWMPSSGYVNSGVAVESAHNYKYTEQKTIKVRALDSKGAYSPESDPLVVDVTSGY
jgi:hypothetical protein